MFTFLAAPENQSAYESSRNSTARARLHRSSERGTAVIVVIAFLAILLVYLAAIF